MTDNLTVVRAGGARFDAIGRGTPGYPGRALTDVESLDLERLIKRERHILARMRRWAA